MQPFAPAHESGERSNGESAGRLSCAAPDQRRSLHKVAAVADEVPITRQAPEFLHGGEINQAVLQQLVGRVRVIYHLPFGVVPDDWRAAQPLEHAYLYFVWPQRDQAVKARGKALQRLTRQAGDQVGVDVDARLAPQETEVIIEPPVVLAALDQFRGLLVESLHPHLELERAGWEPSDDLAQSIRQPVRHHLEVEEEAGPVPFEQELQYRLAGVDIEVEGPIHKLELLHAAVQQPLQVLQQHGQRCLPHGNVERREAELAGEGAAARGFDVDNAVRDVLVVIEVIGQHQFRELGQRSGDDLRGWALTGAQLPANFGECQIRLARDNIVHQLQIGRASCR